MNLGEPFLAQSRGHTPTAHSTLTANNNGFGQVAFQGFNLGVQLIGLDIPGVDNVPGVELLSITHVQDNGSLVDQAYAFSTLNIANPLGFQANLVYQGHQRHRDGGDR